MSVKRRNKNRFRISATDHVLQPGEYKFPFNFNLPQNIPSSFEGLHGHVRYTTVSKLDKPCSRDMETKIIFTVICPLDLNRFPHLTVMPTKLLKKKTDAHFTNHRYKQMPVTFVRFGVCCVDPGPLQLSSDFLRVALYQGNR